MVGRGHLARFYSRPGNRISVVAFLLALLAQASFMNVRSLHGS